MISMNIYRYYFARLAAINVDTNYTHHWKMENADIPVPICVCSMLHFTGGENSQNYRFLPHVVPVPVQHTGRTATGTGLAA